MAANDTDSNKLAYATDRLLAAVRGGEPESEILASPYFRDFVRAGLPVLHAPIEASSSSSSSSPLDTRRDGSVPSSSSTSSGPGGLYPVAFMAKHNYETVCRRLLECKGGFIVLL